MDLFFLVSLLCPLAAPGGWAWPPALAFLAAEASKPGSTSSLIYPHWFIVFCLIKQIRKLNTVFRFSSFVNKLAPETLHESENSQVAN